MAPRRTRTAKNFVITSEVESDTSRSSSTTPSAGTSLATTPATSIRGGKLSKRAMSIDSTASIKEEEGALIPEMMEDEDDEDESVVVPGSRSTPRRNAAAKASTKLVLPKLDFSTDGSDVEVAPKKNKGKGKAVVASSSDEDISMDEIKYGQDASDDGVDADDVERVKALAKVFSNGKGGNESSSRKGKEVAKTLTKALKGKGKAKSKMISVAVPVTASSSAKSSRSGRSAVKPKGKPSGGFVASSGSSNDDSDESAFETPSESEADEEEEDQLDSDVEMELAEFDSDLDDSDDQVDHVRKVETVKKVAKKSRKQEKSEKADTPRVRVKTRAGATITAKQRAALKEKSQFERNKFALNLNHPELVTCWSDLADIPKIVPEKAPQPAGLTRKLLPFQLEGLNWMLKQEAGPWSGGMLADEMGMGKTIQTISLILSDYEPNHTKHTLVLAPTVAILQWRNEIEKFTTGIKVAVFHGSNRLDNVRELEKYDVVLTSYAVLESSFRREHKGFKQKGKDMKEDSILHKMMWNRVILDEAHNIKDRACNTAKAAFALKSKYRWCLSGTPLQNRVGELYSLIRFLGADPFAYYFCKKCDCKSLHWLCNKGPCTECGHSGMQHVCYWNNDVLKPIQYGGAESGEGQRGFAKLTSLLERMMLRRTKVERADDLGLPPRVVNVRRDYFTEEEEEMYLSLFKDVKRKFNTYADEGTVLNNYSNIFTLITRMRQSADHPSLVTHSKTAMPVIHAEGDKPEEILVCRICLDEAEDAIQTSCRHIFCRECMRQYLETSLEQRPECPVCHLHITVDLDQEAIEQDSTGRQGFLSRIDPSKDRTSTKIEALVEELSKLRTEDHTLKSLVFSQFTSMLDLVARRLQLGGFKVVRLQGSMTPTARDNTIKHFTNNPDVTVFLISLKAGGVALNLVEASRVFILDPWWNPAVELQAMDRIHRIGQTRPVVVTRLIIENSIEARILDLQKKKENLAASALGDDDKAMGRLTPEDLRFLFSL